MTTQTDLDNLNGNVLAPSEYRTLSSPQVSYIAGIEQYAAFYVAGFESKQGNTTTARDISVKFTKDGKEVNPRNVTIKPKSSEGGYGTYKIELQTADLEPGVYEIEVRGFKHGDLQIIKDTVELGTVSRPEYFLQTLRLLLFEHNPKLWRVNFWEEAGRWSTSQLAMCLKTSLARLNTAYSHTLGERGWTLEDFPEQLEHLLLNSSLAQAFRVRQSLEEANRHTADLPPVSVRVERDYMRLADTFEQLYQSDLEMSPLARYKDGGSHMGLGRRVRYVENFILMAMVPFGHNIWTI